MRVTLDGQRLAPFVGSGAIHSGAKSTVKLPASPTAIYNGNPYCDPDCVLYLPGFPGAGAKIYDFSGKGNDGTITGATWSRTTQGQRNLSFDGGDDIVRISDHAAFNVGTKMSALIWSNITAPDADFETLIGQFDTGANERSWTISGSGGGGEAKHAFTGSDDGNFGAGHRFRRQTDANAYDGNWHLFGATFNSGAAILYVDRDIPAQSDVFTEITTLHNSNADLTIGAILNSGAAFRFITGNIGEVWVYNRVLSALEIEHVYLATKWRYV